MSLTPDANARRRLAHARPGHAILITIVGNYGLPGAVLAAEWRQAVQVERDPDVERLAVEQGVTIYAHRRVAAYARWHALPLTAHGRGWWSGFAIAHADMAWRDLVRWEYTHPGLRDHGHAPAA